MAEFNLPTCYLISPLPMGHLPGQENTSAKAFAQNVLVPGLKAEGFRIITAEDAFVEAPGASSLAERATLSAREWLEKADLVVIDMTQESPNSVFMIGYRNALDKPCIVYTWGTNGAEGDIAGVRYVKSPPLDTSPSMKVELFREQIKQVLSRSRSTPIASTTPSSTAFGFVPGSAPFDQGNFADTRTAPGSDRLVRLNDNQRDIVDASIVEIAEALRSGEQPTNLSEEERFMVLGQLDLAKQMIKSSPVMTVSVLKILLTPVRFLMDRVTAGIIGNKATELFNFLMQLL